MNCVFVAGVIPINYGPGILSALICSGTAVWQAEAGVNKLRAEMNEMKKELEIVKKNLHALDCRVERYHGSTIASAFVTMKAIDGDKKLMKAWLECMASGGKECM